MPRTANEQAFISWFAVHLAEGLQTGYHDAYSIESSLENVERVGLVQSIKDYIDENEGHLDIPEVLSW